MRQLTSAERPRKDEKRRKKPGRKPGPKRGVPHAKRPRHVRWNPLHITLRAIHGLASFRQQRVYLAFLRAFRTTRFEDFRIVEFSVQTNHLHLVVEAESNEALTRGMKSFAVRANRLFNAVTGRRRGKVWAGRYHRTDLKTPRQVRNALVYCINNGRKHGVVTGTKLVIDACSSAPWFTGWTMTRTVREGPRPTELPRTALLGRLWQKHGRIHPTEAPAN